MNSSIYIFVFHDFLYFRLDLYMFGPLKSLMTFGIIKSKATTQLFAFFRSLFTSVFFYVFVKHKRDLRLKYVLVVLVLLSSKFYLSTNDNIVYNDVKLCKHLQFYSPNYISTCNELQGCLQSSKVETCLLSQFFILNL